MDRRRTNKGRYRIVWVSLWGDEKFRRLSDDGKLLWLYLLTGPVVTTLPGLFAAGHAQLAEALRWSLERFDEAFAELERGGMTKADWDAGVVFLPNAIRHNPPANPNMVLPYRAYWDELPECPMKIEGLDRIVAYLMTCPEGFREAFARAFADVPLRLPELFANRSPNGSPNQDQDPDQDQDQDQEKDHSRAQRGRARAGEGGVEDPGGGEESSDLPVFGPTAEAILAELEARPALREVAERDFASVLGAMVDDGQQTLDRTLRAVREAAVKQQIDRRPAKLLKAFLVGCVLAGPLGRPGPAAAELPEAPPAEAEEVLAIYAEGWARRYGAYCEDPDGADRAAAGRLAAKARRMAPEAAASVGADPPDAWIQLVAHWVKRFLREDAHAQQRHRLDLIHAHLQRYRTPWHEQLDQRLAKTRPEHHAGPRTSGAGVVRRPGEVPPPTPELRELVARLEGKDVGELPADESEDVDQGKDVDASAA
ncbi:hypothetical protein [Sorangium sp. So ce1151]|uniref:hypothetical protein n=1 Tax=Sorangium sp. So ce1151 TaxID=3133332 RepID=UPI003F5FAC1E